MVLTRVFTGRETGVLVAIAALSLLLATTTHFLSTSLDLYFENLAYLTIIAVGMAPAIIAGRIDLSVGAALSLCAVAVAWASQSSAPLVVVLLVPVAIGLAIGAVNGLLVAVGRIEAIVATLGTLIVLRGLNQGVLPSTWAQPSARFQRWGTATHLGVSTAIWLALGAAAAGIALLAQTRAGRRVYAVGSNAGAAELAGVDERRMSFLVMVWSGLMVGVASLAFAPQFSIIQPGSSDGLEILIITAVLIGGTSIFGGKGSVLGAVLGVVLISLVRTALVYYHVPSIWEQAAYGTALLLAVSVDVVRGRRAPATRAAT